MAQIRKRKLAIWKKLFKQATLNRYIDLWNEQLDLKKKRKRKSQKRQKRQKGRRKNSDKERSTGKSC